jgi:[acyl-carrier-protein] S-malonyltransferase
MLDAVPDNDAFQRLLDAGEALTGLELRAIASIGGVEDLSDTRVAQPLLYLTDWAWGAAALEAGLEPEALAGHSLGELTALALGGVFSPEAGLELVVERSKLMATAAASTPGGMVAVLGMDSARIAETIDHLEQAWVANDNSPTQVVVSGADEDLTMAADALEEAGARRIVPLKVAGPFHSPLMEPARAAFEEILGQAEFNDASIPIMNNTDPVPTQDAGEIRSRLAAQITSPVRWTETMQRLAGDGPVTLVEAGPGNVLKGLARGVVDVNAVAIEEIDLSRILEEVCP